MWDIIAVLTLVITMEDFFSTFLRKKIEKWKYVSIWLFFFFLPYDCYEKNGWIFRKYIRKSNCLKYYLLVCVSGNF